MCTTEIQRLERCVISDKVWYYTVWVKPDEFFSFTKEKPTFLRVSAACMFLRSMCVRDLADNFPEILHITGKIILHSEKEQWL